jgi:hypothetical protein
MKYLRALLSQLVIDLPRARQESLSSFRSSVEVVEGHNLAIVCVEGLFTGQQTLPGEVIADIPKVSCRKLAMWAPHWHPHLAH